MIASIFAAIAAGMAGGYLFLDVSAKDVIDKILMYALDFMILVAGIEIGSNRSLLLKICTPKNIMLALAIPLSIVIGSFAGGWASLFFTGLNWHETMLVTAGLGWYSLASVAISTMYSSELGTVSFLTNMLREASAFILLPFLARWHKLLCLAPGAAGTMDSLLPMIIKLTDMRTGMFAFVSGFILSLLIPVFLGLLLE